MFGACCKVMFNKNVIEMYLMCFSNCNKCHNNVVTVLDVLRIRSYA